jgi:hypothetical protein
MTLIELDSTPTISRCRVDATTASAYLAFGHVPATDLRDGAPVRAAETPTTVADADDLIDALVERLPRSGEVGVLLGGDPASATLAALLPPDTPCYSVCFDAPGAVDTSRMAAEHAVHWGHPHLSIRVSWSDHLAHAPTLMLRKDAPLGPMEIALYLVAQVAAADGVTDLVTGTGAGAVFGGATELLSHDWTFEQFVARYPLLDPADFLTDPVDVSPCYERYRVGHEIDVARFLREIHAVGTAGAHRNALTAAGVRMHAPYLDLAPAGPLDLRRIRAGEAAPIVADAYRLVYDDDQVPLRPHGPDHMDVWLDGWAGPAPRPGLRDDILGTLAATTGAAKWRLWSLAAHLDLIDRSPSLPLLTADD